MADRWEYTTMTGSNEVELNKLGNQGWEVAGVVTIGNGNTGNVILKRKIDATPSHPVSSNTQGIGR